jgi:ferredoxin
VVRVTADRELCIGSENCTRYAPKTFSTDAEGKVVVAEPIDDDEDTVRTAASACPMGALVAED